MEFRYTEAEEKFKQELDEFFQKEVTEEVQRENERNRTISTGLPATRELLRKLGKNGWLEPSLPREYGGIGASHMMRYIFSEALEYYAGIGYPAPPGVCIVAPSILSFGDEDHKKEFLPRLGSGEIDVAILYTEPEAGSDLASLETKAVEDGDYFVVNGQKTFNSHGHYSEYFWLAARTDPNAPKHKGISLFILDAKTPGITIRPLYYLWGERGSEVFFDDVRIPRKCLVGDKNKGFYYVMGALGYERMYPVGIQQRFLEELVEFASGEKHAGRLLLDEPFVRQSLAEMQIRIQIVRLFNQRVASLLEKGTIPVVENSIASIFCRELKQFMARTAMQMIGLYGQLQEGSKWAPMQGRIEREYRESLMESITPGSSEVMRNVIATSGLKLPRMD